MQAEDQLRILSGLSICVPFVLGLMVAQRQGIATGIVSGSVLFVVTVLVACCIFYNAITYCHGDECKRNNRLVYIATGIHIFVCILVISLIIKSPPSTHLNKAL